MEKVCPVCNKITNETFICNNCGGILVNKGRVDDYLDPYSADMPIEDGETYCMHIFQCTGCNNKENKKIIRVTI